MQNLILKPDILFWFSRDSISYFRSYDMTNEGEGDDDTIDTRIDALNCNIRVTTCHGALINIFNRFQQREYVCVRMGHQSILTN